MVNRTSKYLYSWFSDEDLDFRRQYNNVKKKSLYIGDDGYTKETGIKYSNHMYVLFDSKSVGKNFSEILTYFRTIDIYEDDYYVDESSHMVVFKLNEQFRLALLHFKRSRYSKMYPKTYYDKYFNKSEKYALKYNDVPLTEEDLNKLIEKKSFQEIQKDITFSPYSVLTKSEKLKNIMEILYETKFTKEMELGPSINLEEEIFRYDKELRIFDATDRDKL